MPSYIVAYPLLLGLAAALLPDGVAGRRGLAGAVLAALAVASLEVVGGDDWRSASLPPGYLATTAALLLFALCLTVAGGGSVWRRSPLAMLALGAGGLLALVIALPVVVAGGVGRTLVALGAIAGATVLMRLAARRFGRGRVDRIDAWLRRREQSAHPSFTAPRPAPASRRPLGLLAAHLALTIIALSVAHLHLLLGAVLLAAIIGWAFEREARGGGRRAVGFGVSVSALIIVWWLLASVAGDTPLGFAALPDAPYSNSFQLLVTPILLLAAWPLLHLAPFQTARQGPAAPVLGAVLLFRLGPTALSSGVVHWQPALFLLLVLAAVAAVVRRNDATLLTAFGVGGILSLAPTAGWTGLGLVVLACVLAGAGRITATGYGLSGIGQRLATLVPVAGVALLLSTLEGMLGVEVVYSAVFVLVAMLALSRQPSAISELPVADG